MENNRIYYVYMITNNLNGMRYIGKRTFHGTDISKDTYMGSSKRLKASIRKHGVENYTKQIIEICNSEDEVFEAENWWTKAYNAVANPMFYNMVEGGRGGDSNRTETDEANKKRSEAQLGEKNHNYGKPGTFKGKHHTEETKRRMTESRRTYYAAHPKQKKEKVSVKKPVEECLNVSPVLCVDNETGKVIHKYDKMCLVEKDDFNVNNVGYCCKGKQFSHKGYIWVYARSCNCIIGDDGFTYVENYVKREKPKKTSSLKGVKRGPMSDADKAKKRTSQPNKKAVVCIDKHTGEIVKTYESVKSVKLDGYNFANVRNCCKGKIKTHKGYRWMYLDDYNSQYEILNLFQMCR